jgi:single-strand DNA-binding protein
MINNVTLVGRLAQDPTLRYTANGTAVVNLRLATNGPYINDDGQRSAVFLDVVVWGKLAEVVAQYKKRGEIIGVIGKLNTRSYTDSRGVQRRTVEVVADLVQFIGRKNGEADNTVDGYQPPQRMPQSQKSPQNASRQTRTAQKSSPSTQYSPKQKPAYGNDPFEPADFNDDGFDNFNYSEDDIPFQDVSFSEDDIPF